MLPPGIQYNRVFQQKKKRYIIKNISFYRYRSQIHIYFDPKSLPNKRYVLSYEFIKHKKEGLVYDILV